MKKTVLITDRFSTEAWVTLENQNYIQLKRAKNYHLRDEDLAGVNGMIIRSRTEITAEVFKRAPDLQVIVTSTSGFDHIDLEAAAEWGVTVMFTPEANVASATELTWALIHACARKILPAQKLFSAKALSDGDWARDGIIGTELCHKTLGIVGLGRIGSRVAQIAKALQMPVVAYDPFIEEDDFKKAGAERVAFEELLKSSDVISFHVPKTPMTKYMLNRSHLEYIHRGVILVNTSRGSVIKEMDLCEAIADGWVGAAGLDVFEKEPLPPTSKLLSFPQVVLTPHVGANTHEAFYKASEMAALKLLRFFVDGTASDSLPPKAAWYNQTNPWA